MDRGQHTRTWREGVDFPAFPSLDGDLSVDTIIVGGGMAGVLSAYSLSKEGKQVALIEKSLVGSGATELTTAFLSQSIDTDFAELEKMFGDDKTRLIVGSHGEAIDYIEKIVQDEDIDCDLKRCSNFIYTKSPKDISYLIEETETAKRLGLDAAFKEDRESLGFETECFIEIRNQAKFHPLRFLSAVASLALKNGALIYENTEACSIQAAGGEIRIETRNKSVIRAKRAIVATYEPFNKPLGLYFKKGFYISYAVETGPIETDIPEGIYEDAENPYHYFRVDLLPDDRKRIIAGGEDHRMQIPIDPEKNLVALREHLDAIIPKGSYETARSWHGPILEPADGLALIGTIQDIPIFYAMAFSGNGMTYSAITAMMARDYVLGKQNEYRRIYAADRIPSIRSLIYKGRDYADEIRGGALKNAFKKRK